MTRLEEVEAELADILRKTKRPQLAAAALARTLAAEIDELRGKLDDVRQNIGCARGQRTTQFCAEAAQRDEVIGKVLELLKPGEHAIYDDTETGFLSRRELYARACEIAGRTE